MKISRNDPCPCGSKRKYKQCCIPKSISNDGAIPITSEIQEILDTENERFKAIMGRDITGDDPIMPSALTMSESEYKRVMTKLFSEINVNPGVIYAFNKLGYCLVEDEDQMYTDEQIELWNDAITEYESLEKNGKDLKSKEIDTTIENVYKVFDKLQFLYALIIRKYANNSDSIDLSVNAKPIDYILFCSTRNLKTIKAINLLAINDYPEDAFNLARTNIENYAEIVHAKYDGLGLKNQIIAENGIFSGSHTRKGKRIINNSNGQVVNLKNNYEKIELHPKYKDLDCKIYNIVYPLLSSYTHPDIATAINYIDTDHGFTDLKENSNINPIIIVLIINFMIIHELHELDHFQSSKDDLIKQNIQIAEVLLLVDKIIGKLNQIIIQRIQDTINTYS